MTLLMDILSGLFLAAGAFFAIVGGIGLLRMPDVFTRMHAASVTETLGAGFMLIGLMLQSGLTLVTAKLAIMGLLILLASPTSSHALARAALMSGLKPLLGKQLSDAEVPSSKP